MRLNLKNPRFSRPRRIVAEEELEEFDEEVMDTPEVDDEAPEGEVSVADEAQDLLFEAEDVAELLAEVTGEAVEVTADENAVEFKVAEDVYTVQPEGDEEVLESTRRPFKGRRAIRASRRPMARRPLGSARRPVSASTNRPATRRPATRRPVNASRAVRRTSRRVK